MKTAKQQQREEIAELYAEVERLKAMRKILEEEVERLHQTYAAEIDRLKSGIL